MPRFLRAALPYLLALSLGPLGILLIQVIGPPWGGLLAVVVYIAPIVLAAWLGGMRPGLLATLVLILATLPYFWERLDSTRRLTNYGLGTGIYLMIGVLLSWLVASLQSARRRVKAELRIRSEAEVQAHDERERLRVTLASIGDGVITTDAEGCVTYLNPVAEQLTGWTAIEAVGQPLKAVFPFVNEQLGESVPNELILQRVSSITLPNHTVLISRDGRRRPVHGSAARISDAQGANRGLVLVFRDVTQQRRAEASLRQSEEQFRTLANSIPQLAWIAGPDGVITWHNQRSYEYFGTAPGSVGQWQDQVDPHDAARVRNSYLQAIAQAKKWECTFRLMRHDGVYRSHLSLAIPIRNEDGHIQKWFGTCTDITERVELEQALREADRRKDQFLATLAHELRNPLAPISNGLQVWRLVQHQPNEMEQLREMMERQVQQMVRLIDDLLDVSRITRGKIQLRRQAVDLGTVIQSAIEVIRPFAATTGHNLEVCLPDEPLVVDGDVARLVQVFSNLLHNAIKYTDRGCRVWVSIQRQDDRALISVRDNGSGIPVEKLASIFDPFMQVDQTLGRSHGGLGIGLTLARSLVELHGGNIQARSQGPGTGSEFVVELPLQSDHRAAEQMPKRLLADFSSVPKHRVLIVDDMAASARTLAMMLNAIGQEVEVSHDGRSALETALQMRPSVVFLDIAMPGMDGYEVARRMRAHPRLNGVSLVALTGYGQEEDRRRAYEAGFDHHLVKPASFEVLEQLLTQVPNGAHRQPAMTAGK